MRRTALILLVAIIWMALGLHSAIASDTPARVTENYFAALAQGNLVKVMNCCADDVNIRMLKFDQQVKRVVVTNEKVEGGKATVEVWLYNKSGRGSGCEELVMEDGAWKISASSVY